MTAGLQDTLFRLHRFLSDREPLFTLFKVGIFLCLFVTSGIYIAADIQAASRTLDASNGFMDWLSMYAISIDVIAWVTLLIIYELETSTLEDEVLNSGWKWLLYVISALCYIAIFWAMAGYIGKLLLITDYSLFSSASVCSLGSDWVQMKMLDDFVPLNGTVCAGLEAVREAGNLYQLNGEQILFTRQEYYGLGGAWSIAWSDVIEGILWIAVMAMIQLEIVLQLRQELSPILLRAFSLAKAACYLLVILVTVYYSVFGRAVDIYDSILWLLAFLFIELNLSEWTQKETAPEGAVLN